MLLPPATVKGMHQLAVVCALMAVLTTTLSSGSAGATSPTVDAGADAGSVHLGDLFEKRLGPESFGDTAVLGAAAPGGLAAEPVATGQRPGDGTTTLGSTTLPPRPMVNDVRVVGSLSRDLASPILSAALSTARCHGMPGLFHLRLRVQANGRVRSASVLESDGGVEGAACLVEAARSWSFPQRPTSSVVDATIGVDAPR